MRWQSYVSAQNLDEVTQISDVFDGYYWWYFFLKLKKTDESHRVFRTKKTLMVQQQPLILRDEELDAELVGFLLEYDQLNGWLSDSRYLNTLILSKQLKMVHQVLYKKLLNAKYNRMCTAVRSHLFEQQPTNEDQMTMMISLKIELMDKTIISVPTALRDQSRPHFNR